MWQLTVYNKEELILKHEQNDYGKVLKFGMNSLAELMNTGAKDFRITMIDKEGNLYFSAIGEGTQIIGLRKKGTPV